MTYNDLTGQRFNRLVAISKIGRAKDRQIIWQCLCDCGELTEVSSTVLRKGYTKSCGCLQKEIIKKIKTTHGKSYSRVYSIWKNIITRCKYTSHKQYWDYGGRGIKVCEKWLKFENFFVDMGEPPIGLSIDRINVNGNYEPRNCRWATKSEQENNKRKHS